MTVVRPGGRRGADRYPRPQPIGPVGPIGPATSTGWWSWLPRLGVRCGSPRGGPRSVSSCGSAGSRCLLVDQAPHGGGEVVAPLGVAAVPVERGAAGRQQRPRRRARASSAAGVTASAIDAAATTGRRPEKAAATSERGLADGDHGPRRGRPRLAAPTGRGPCCGRRRSAPPSRTPRTAAKVACGAVAFESSYQVTPRHSPTRVTRWGSATKVRSVVADPADGRHRPRPRWPTRRVRWRGRGEGGGAARRPHQQLVGVGPQLGAGHPVVRGPVDAEGHRAHVRAHVLASPPGRRRWPPPRHPTRRGRTRCAPWPLRSGRASRARRGGPRRSSTRSPPPARTVACARGGTRTPRPRTPRCRRVVDGLDEGHVRVAGGQGPAPRPLEHVGDHRGHRGLAVGARDGDAAVGRPTPRRGRTR